MQIDQTIEGIFSPSNAVTIRRQGAFDLDLAPDDALPLFTALGEKLWITG